MRLSNLDMDVLRTLVLAERLGGFGRAAERVGRSQSAVSQQVRKIEVQVGEPLFEKQGRGLVPTPAGEVLLAYARRILDLNDEALIAVRGTAARGEVRFGLPADLAETWLPDVLGRFSRGHPAVRLETVVDRNRVLVDRLDRGDLDVALAMNQIDRADARPLAELEAIWIGPPPGRLHWDPAGSEALPLVLTEAPCFFRQRALALLEAAGIPWRVVLTSTSARGLWAAVEAGLGMTLRIPVGVPTTLQTLGIEDGLPDPTGAPFVLSIHDGGRILEPGARQLYDILAAAITDRPTG
jgi:DNA-binding transcriptional LysR family regulator